MRSSKQNANTSSTSSRTSTSREGTKFGSRTSARSDTTASTRTSRNDKRDGATEPKQQSGEPMQTSRQQRRQQEFDEDPSGDEYSDASVSVDTDQIPGSYAIDGPSRQNREDQQRMPSDGQESTSALPVALPAELVPDQPNHSNNPGSATVVLATAAPDKDDEADEETKRMLKSQMRMLWIGLVVIFILALAAALGFGLAFGGNRNDGGTVAGEGEAIVAPPAITETPLPAPTPSPSAPTANIDLPSSSSTDTPADIPTGIPTPRPNTFDEAPISAPTPTPTATMPTGVCSCWYYTQENFITTAEEREPLTGERIGYWESVYRGLTSYYDPRSFRRTTRRRLPANKDGIVITTNVVLESQQPFGGDFSRFRGLSMAFQLEFCASPAPANATAYLMDYHDAFVEWNTVAEHSDIIVERLQEEVGITSAYGTSVASRLDLQCN